MSDTSVSVGQDIGKVAGGSVNINWQKELPEEVAHALINLPRIDAIIRGDGFREKGIMHELEEVKHQIRALTDEVANMKVELSAMKKQVKGQGDSDYWTRLLMVLLALSLAAQMWQMFFP